MNTTLTTPRNEVLVGDAREHLAALPDASVDMALTSPPYFRLRDYDVDGQLGLEDNVDEWVTALRRIAKQIHRVLTPTGTFWLNVGDTYSTHLPPRRRPQEPAARSGTARAALIEDGWMLRNKIVWQQDQPPTDGSTRPTGLYLGSAPTSSSSSRTTSSTSTPSACRISARRRPKRGRRTQPHARRLARRQRDDASGLAAMKADGRVGHPLGKNPGDVWRIAPATTAAPTTRPSRSRWRSGRSGPAAPRPAAAGAALPWRRPVTRAAVAGIGQVATRHTLQPTCACVASSEPGLVLDPFIGAARTGVAARASATVTGSASNSTRTSPLWPTSGCMVHRASPQPDQRHEPASSVSCGRSP